MPSIFTSAWQPAPRSLPPGTTACAIGDVHGCTDLLRALLGHLAAEVPAGDPAGCLVLMGDYIDRGPDSLGTLSLVRDLALPGWEIVRLLGNHDLFLALIVGQDAIDGAIDMAFVESWLDVGGASTFREMGLGREDLIRRPLAELRDLVRARLPAGAADLLAGLAPWHRIGDYLFVHAGLDPRTPLEAHDVSDLVMIREPFLSGAGWSHAVTVVHGHTIRGHEALPHRISVDTGAYRTGLLSCLQLEGDRLRWIVASASGDLAALGRLARAAPAPRYDGPAEGRPDGEAAR